MVNSPKNCLEFVIVMTKEVVFIIFFSFSKTVEFSFYELMMSTDKKNFVKFEFGHEHKLSYFIYMQSTNTLRFGLLSFVRCNSV